MKLATKISAGFLVLIGVMLLALVHQASIIFSLHSVSEQLSHVNFQAAHLGYQMKQDLSLIEEAYAYRYRLSARGDQMDAGKFSPVGESFPD